MTETAPLPLLVLVGGAPGSGKTTLARRLAADLPLPLWTKDFVKETLGDGLGARGLEASRQLSRPTFAVFYHVLNELVRAGVGVVAECNYRRGISEAELRPIVASARAIQVFCQASPEVCLRRVVERYQRGERGPKGAPFTPTASAWRKSSMATPRTPGARTAAGPATTPSTWRRQLSSSTRPMDTCPPTTRCSGLFVKRD